MRCVAIPLFAFEAVTVAGAGDRHRLREATGEVEGSGVTAIVGPSGAGKSTLLRCCNRLEAPDSGVVRFRGDDIAGLDVLTHRRRVGMVFQRPTPFPGSCAGNLRVADPALGDDDISELLSRVGLASDLAPADASALSVGEAQRLCTARALAARPEVLLMDEPTSALDPVARTGLERLVRALAAAGVAVLWVSHDRAQVERIADAVVVVIDGRVAGPTETAAYLAGSDRAE